MDILDKREAKRLYDIEYREKNKERIKIQRSAYREKNKKPLGHPNKKYKHGMCYTKMYMAWANIKSRCKGKTNSKNDTLYFGRGITYDPRWEKFENLLVDMGIRPDGKELDRIDGTKGYYKENCRWVTKSHNNANRLKIKRYFPRGVRQNKNLFTARIKINSLEIHLGSRETIEAAEQLFLSTYKEWYGEMPPEYRNKERI
jgi:hypothetical protein